MIANFNRKYYFKNFVEGLLYCKSKILDVVILKWSSNLFQSVSGKDSSIVEDYNFEGKPSLFIVTNLPLVKLLQINIFPHIRK